MEPFLLPVDVLRSGADELGVALSDEQIDLYIRYAQMLVEANARFNLTRISQPLDIVRLHYLDSLTCLAVHRPEDKSEAIDVGSGAGFPGLAIKIAVPQIQMRLVDSTAKKVRFLQSVISSLGIDGASAVCARAEDMGRDSNHRQRYKTVYARAVAALPVLAELCMPLLKVGGVLVAQKADNIDAEIAACRKILGNLGAQSLTAEEIVIPGTDIRRKIVMIPKTKPTQPKYPRSYAEIIRSNHPERKTGKKTDE